MIKRICAGTCVLFAILMFPAGDVIYGKSVNRDGEAIITLNKLTMPEVVKQGEFFHVIAEMSSKKNIWDNMLAFLHLVSAKDDKILLNNDFVLGIPTTSWTPGEVVMIGPVNCYIPQDFPPGLYNVKMGLYATKVTPETVLYVREPYTNPEIKGFVVKTIKVEGTPADKEVKKEDLVISNFDSLVDIRKWQLRGTTMQTSDNTAVGERAAKVTYLKAMGGCPSVILESFFGYSDPKYSYWADYDVLQFYIYGDADEKGNTPVEYPVTLQVKDKAENRFQMAIPTMQDRGKPFSVNLSVIGRQVDLANIGNLSFFVVGTPPDKDWVIYLDDIRLVSLGLEKLKTLAVKFEGLKIPKNRVKAGEQLEFQPSFSVSQKLSEEYGLFIHIYRQPDKAGWLNADMTPTPPTTEWEPNTVISQGPFSVFIPLTAPPGTYAIEVGLFLPKQVMPGEQYVKYHRGKDGTYYIEQPNYPVDFFKLAYSNYEQYGDWVVGTFEVLAP